MNTNEFIDQEIIGNNSRDTLYILLDYLMRELPIFSVHWVDLKVPGKCSCDKPDCSSPVKHLLTPYGYKKTVIDKDQIIAWHKKWLKANWGMPTGKALGIDVIDIDPRQGQKESWTKLQNEMELDGNEVQSEVHTGSRGFYRRFVYSNPFFFYPGILGPGIDIRCNSSFDLISPFSFIDLTKTDAYFRSNGIRIAIGEESRAIYIEWGMISDPDDEK